MQKKLLSQKWHDKQSVVDGALKNKTGDGSLSQNEYDGLIGSRGQFFCPLDFTSISDGTYTTSNAYDSANQLIREENQEANTITVWTYDNAGNILTVPCASPNSYSFNDLYRMKQGLAPIGADGFSMELHHPFGRKNGYFYVIEPLTRTEHRWIHFGGN